MRPLIALLSLLPLCACDVQDQAMRTQKKFVTSAPSDLWRDGTSARPVPAHTQSTSPAPERPQANQTLLKRGREQYEIFCTPCHGYDGRGEGTVVQRGFPKPPSYFETRLVNAPATHFFDVITNGFGVMFPYGARVAPQDRWAIIAYIRALQLSTRAHVAESGGQGEAQP